MSVPQIRKVRCRRAKRAIGVAFLAVAIGVAPLLTTACRANVRLGDLPADGGAEAALVDSAAAETAVDGDAFDVGISPLDGDSSDNVDASFTDAAADAAQSVAKVSGLVLWLDGDRGITRPAAGGFTWSDQSGHGNDAIAPRAVPPSTSTGFNGHAALAFDSTQLLTVADNATVRFGADYTVLVVALSSTPASQYGALFGKPAAAYPFAGPGLYVNYPPLAGAPSSTVGAQIDFNDYIESAQQGVSDGIARIFEMQRTATMLSIRVDSNPPIATTVPPTDITAPGVDVFIGGHLVTSVVQGLTGAIAEVLAVNGTVSASDYASLHAYLAGKYAIP